MLGGFSSLIGTQPIFAIFLAVGLGYAVGQISILGFSLGIGAVLFVGIFFGAIAPKAHIDGPIGLIGLIMFLYGIGILYGRQFFEGLTGHGRKSNLLALVAVIAGLAVTLALARALHLETSQALGLFAGSMTSTATLQAAIDVTDSQDPSVGYSVAYPFGVIGPILCFYFMTRRIRPKFPAAPVQFHMAEVTIKNLSNGRTTLRDLIASLPVGAQVTGVRQEHRNILPTPDTMLREGDAVMLVAETEKAVEEAAARIGHLEPGRLAGDRRDLSYQRFFVSKHRLTGIPIGRLPMPPDIPMQILHVRRYDADLVPSPDLILEIGDRIGVIVPNEHITGARAWFGDTVKSTAEFSYISLGLGMAIGVLLGLLPIPIPFLGTVTLGIGGGPLIVALIVGRLRRTGPISWVMPLPANIALRNFGLTLFLATVGINSGHAFLTAIVAEGWVMLLIGAVVVLVTVTVVLLGGFFLLGIPFDDLLGVASGATGNPAILVYAARMAPTDRPDINYAMIFPSATILKVIAVQLVGLMLPGH
jgi:putative transport protein